MTCSNPQIQNPTTPGPLDSCLANRAASAAKTEASIADLNCVVAAIGDMSINWEEVAQQQPLDPEFRDLRANARNGLNFKSIDIGRRSLIVDTSNGPYRPYIPFAFRKRIFNAVHGLGHPGVERTRQMMCAKFVWPSIRQDSSKWARECLPCQQSKVTRHVTPPIGNFVVPNKRFQHINLDLVTLPQSNSYKYLLTAVDRFTRWPIAVPLKDMTAESVLDGFSHGWVQHYGVPATITTDRGAQFTSALFTQLSKLWGIQTIMTTAYHPEANGLVERFHRRLKEALIALGSEAPEDWYWRLPCALLAIRTTLKPDLGASPADLVYGEGLAVPGEMLPSVPATDAQLACQRASALADARLEVSRLQPIQTSAHRKPLIHLPQELDSCSHVFVRRGHNLPGGQQTLAAPYVGPFRVISRNTINFKIAVPGRPNETVAIARVKPVYASPQDAEDAEPAPRRPAGRQPRAPRHPPPPRQRSQRRGQSNDRDEDAQPPPPPRTPPDPQQPPRRNRSRRRSRPVEQDSLEPSPPPPPHRRDRSRRIDSDSEEQSPQADHRAAPAADPQDASEQLDADNDFRNIPDPIPDWAVSDDEFFGDNDPAPPPSPMPNRPTTDWFSPEPSPPPPPTPPPPPPQPRRKKKRVGNPNWVKGGSFAGHHQRRFFMPDDPDFPPPNPDANAISKQLSPRPLEKLLPPRQRLFSSPEKGSNLLRASVFLSSSAAAAAAAAASRTGSPSEAAK